MNDFATDDKASTSSSCQIFSKIDDSRVENLQFSSCSNTPCNKDKDSRQFKSVSDFCSHFWESRSHVRPTFCNFCQEPLSGMVWTGLCCQ
uniref:Phorbol-ester/DAG-type domain-containing protein n=1 Tax=Romanomermis culicivorax TaxID=13658 RepID=A0A915I258_ROMCU